MTELGASTTATLLFTDVEGSTELRVRVGDAPATAILREHEDVVRRCVKEHGGWEVKALGDGFLIAFDSARRAAACAVTIQQTLDERNQHDPARGVRVRMGLHSGEVDRLGGDMYGQAVHVAARIAGTAAGGEILVSDTVRQLVAGEPGMQLRDRGRHRLKGLAEKMRLHELVWSEKQAVVAPAIVSRRTRFVGRSDEQAELVRHLDSARGGRGGLVFVGGEPGVGKTRLAEEVASHAARAGVQVLIGHSYEMEGGSPFVPFVEIFEQALSAGPDPESFLETLGDDAPEVARLVPHLRRLFPDLPPPLQLPPDQERRYLFDSVRRVLERMAQAAPMLLVLDDVQWVDEATLRLLDHLTPTLAEAPMLVVATYRDTDVGPSLSRLLADLHRRRLVKQLTLDPLGRDGVAEILTALSGREPPAGLVEAIYSETEGNPFFIEEVFQYLAEQGQLFDEEGAFRPIISELDVPSSVRFVIGRRLERLSEEAQRLLAAAAVAGRVFSFRLLQALTDLGPDAVLDVVDEAEQAKLIRESGGEDEFLFSHELIRQTLVAGLSGPRRRRAHLRAAHAMMQVWAATLPEHASEVAHHLVEAGDEADPKLLLAYSLLAGRRALDTSAFEEALSHFERAAMLEPVAAPRQRAELFFGLGSARSRLGQWDAALVAWQRSLEAYEGLGDHDAVGGLCVEAGLNLGWANKLPESIAMYQHGLGALGERVSADRARLLARMGVIANIGGEPAAGDSMFADALRLADELDDEALRGFALGEMCCGLYISMRPAAAVSAGTEGVAIMRTKGDLWGAATALGFLKFALVHCGRFSDAATVGDEITDLADRIGNYPALYLHGRARGSLEFWQSGNLDNMEDYGRWNLEFTGRHFPGFLGHCYSWLGLVAFLRGDWDTAAVQLGRGAADPPAIVPGFCWGSWFHYLAFAGRRDEALTFFEDKRSLLPEPSRPNTWTAWTLLMAFTEGLFVLGNRDELVGWYPLILEARATGAVPTDNFEGRLLERVAGIAATAAGNWDAAEEHFQRALRQADELPHQLERLETRRFYAQMLFESDRDRQRAEQLLTEAIDGYHHLGMPRHAEMARQIAREASA